MRIVVSITLLLCAILCYGLLRVNAATPQQGRTETAEKMFLQTLRNVRAAKKELAGARAKPQPSTADIDLATFHMKNAVIKDINEWATYLIGTEAVKSFLSEAEQRRIDKQVGGGANSSGSTSLVS